MRFFFPKEDERGGTDGPRHHSAATAAEPVSGFHTQLLNQTDWYDNSQHPAAAMGTASVGSSASKAIG